MNNIKDIIDKLSPIERKIIPFLGLPLPEISEKSGLDITTTLRALKFLQNKGIIKITAKTQSIIDLGTNGIYYKKNHLPERRLLIFLEENQSPTLLDARSQAKLSDNEFKAALGALKKKALIDLRNGRILLRANKAEISKKSLEEQFLESLPTQKSSLPPEMLHAFESLKNRKEIIEIKEQKTLSFEVTELGILLSKQKIDANLIEEVTPTLIKTWNRGKKFRKYDISSQLPQIYGGRKHFVNQAIEYGKQVWLDLGFKEMSGNKVQTSFWNFDALFTAQDHPVREMQDTFFIKGIKGSLPSTDIVKKVKQAHESGVSGSRGWQYKWSEDEAKSLCLRTHTTCLSARTLASINPKTDLPAKFFAIGKNFRNETVDWSHGFEFNQSEGIVIDKDANLRHLIGYLKEFARKMGFEDIRIQPAYFPYVEPGLEGSIWHPEKKQWIEVLAAGILRPEVVIPLLGEDIPVLAWGPGFDRLMMLAYEMDDMRKLYSNDLKDLRNKRAWIK
ncbi:MAG: phenylalanine--tRNA ligase subunit alpha [Colwelliaceae bacterium]|nr:phenylalanine--tRNA ligase subunit alpha [Colwelliaceae bacterium]|tara:strand:- start:3869 stop:5380 length:1512 start_codon:yes stop_codon:yes gene_type:complete